MVSSTFINLSLVLFTLKTCVTNTVFTEYLTYKNQSHKLNQEASAFIISLRNCRSVEWVSCKKFIVKFTLLENNQNLQQ